MSAPLTPRCAGSPRRVVKLEYETPQFLPSPACLAPDSCLSTGSRPTSATTTRRKRTPRRIITSEVDGAACEHEGWEYMDIVSGLLERSCIHLVQKIFYYLHETDLNSVRHVCRKWRRAFNSDTVAQGRHSGFYNTMRVYVRSVGAENAPSPKMTCVGAMLSEQRPSLGVRSALSDLSNMSKVKRDPKSTKATGSVSTLTPSRPVGLDTTPRPLKLNGLTPEEAVKKAKKITSAKKDSRMRRLRC